METHVTPKAAYPKKVVRIDATTWIETKADVPDEVARRKFLDKLASLIKPQLQDQGLNIL